MGRILRFTSVAAVVALVAVGCSHKKTAKPAAASASPTPSATKASATPTPSGPPQPPPPPPTCPRTGLLAPTGGVPNRAALAVKVENAPESRPPVGLDNADIVYEEPVEGGITRFVVVYQCTDAPRVEPVRSVRQADVYIVNQFGKSLFANAGGSPPTLEALQAAVRAGWLVDVGYSTGGGYNRDGRPNPHNLYTSTPALYSRPDAKGLAAPNPVFTYSTTPAAGGPGQNIHIAFSQYSDVNWRWNPTAHVYQRYYGNSPATLANGAIISSPNVIVQDVAVTMSWWIEDPSGSHQPVPSVLGKGVALICRAGTCVPGQWNRPGQGLSQITYYLDAAGKQVPLVPGITWVELAPTSVAGPGPIPVASVAAS